MEKINDKDLNEFILKPSTRKNKKYMLVSNKTPSIHFGGYGMSDYTIHKDPGRKLRYIMRHRKNEEQFWSHTKKNLLTPSYLSKWLTWEFPDINDAIKFVEKK